MGTVHHFQPQQPVAPALTYLTPEFAKRLGAFNAMTRELREAGIEIEALVEKDNRIFIRAEDSDLIKTNFLSEIRGMRYRTKGNLTHNVVTIRGVDVAWLTPVKEQDQ
ncbi:hypothetical protein [Pseudomonas knackmussii]|uniref:hypothetical protein n=1 Tax=Pseudomonas knackmussii TaxID=65741 RepID=UPI003F49B55F